MKQKEWLVVIGILLIVAILWVSGGFREMFTSVNPVLATADIESMVMNNGVFVSQPSANALSAIKWAQTNIQFPSSLGFVEQVATIVFQITAFVATIGAGNVDAFNSFISSLPSSPTTSDVVSKFYSFVQTNNPSMSSTLPDQATVVSQINGGQSTISSVTDINWIYWIYKYYLGEPVPTPPPPPPPPAPATPPPSAPTPPPSAPTPSASTPSLVPVPAASTSTQPMSVGVPVPCNPSYASIPGGSVEFRCFS